MTDIMLNKGTLDENIRYFLQDNYACLRVWGAWSYGTMTEDDFRPMEEDDDIVGDLKALIAVEVERENKALKTERLIHRSVLQQVDGFLSEVHPKCAPLKRIKRALAGDHE